MSGDPGQLTESERASLDFAYARVTALIRYHTDVLAVLDSGVAPVPAAVTALVGGMQCLLAAQASIEAARTWQPTDQKGDQPPPARLHRGLTREQRAAIWDAVDWTLHDVEIGRAIGAEPSTVGQQRRKRGVPPTPGAAGVMRDKVLRLTRAGQSRQAVAEALGVSIGTVRHHLREARREGRLHSPDEDTT